MAESSRTPWKRPNLRKRAGKSSRKLSPAKRTAAKASARRAGRPYPNLVDNMRMAAKSKKKSAKKKSARKQSAKHVRKSPTRKDSPAKKRAKKSSRKRSAKVIEKDPRGGLTAAGRKAFSRKQGSHLKPAITKKVSEMSPQEMRRKGSWATRFYGRAKLPPLVDAKGQPTRHALSAHAWGEPVPKTVAAARRIAEKGHRLLARYRKLKAT